jgi:hypothetical protein
VRHPAELISAFFDDSLGEGELDELRAWLAADAANMREFARESVIHSRLRDVMLQHDMRGLVFDGAFGESVDPQHIASLLAEDELSAARRAREAAEQAHRDALAAMRRDELLSRKAQRVEEPRYPRALIYAGVAAAAALLLMAGHFLGPTPPPGPLPTVVHSAPAPAAEAAKAVPVAMVANTFNAVMRHDREPVRTGASLGTGTLRLERGVAEVRFASSVRIIVESPAELELLTAERARLVSGRVVVQVPEEAVGFTLRSDAATFVDLGTEFGVEIDGARRANMHVLDGKVAFVPKEKATPSRTLERGAATQVSVDGTAREIPFDEARFMRRVPTSAYELAVHRSRPLAYWRLDDVRSNAALVSEGLLPISSFANGEIASAANRIGGGPRRAARFEGEHDGIDVGAEARLGMVSNCTYEAWVAAEQAPSGPQRIFSTFDRPRSGMAIGIVDGPWYKLPDARLKFHLTLYGVYDCISEAPVAMGQWVHLAATVDAAGAPTLYVNGAATKPRFRNIAHVAAFEMEGMNQADAWTEEGETPLGNPTGGQARIGRNPLGSDGQISPERWRGQISNVAVYDRVLGADEVREHYLATRDKATNQRAAGER